MNEKSTRKFETSIQNLLNITNIYNKFKKKDFILVQTVDSYK